MLNLEQIQFLIELCNTPGVSVPIKAAKLAGTVLETLEGLKKEAEAREPAADKPAHLPPGNGAVAEGVRASLRGKKHAVP